jgi:hypothetical protein
MNSSVNVLKNLGSADPRLGNSMLKNEVGHVTNQSIGNFV